MSRKIEVVESYIMESILKNGELPLVLMAQISEYLGCDLIDLPYILEQEYLRYDLGAEVVMVKDCNDEVVALAIYYISYDHVHVRGKTLIVDAMFSVKGCKLESMKMLKFIYAEAQRKGCHNIQTTQSLGIKGVGHRFITTIRKIVRS